MTNTVYADFAASTPTDSRVVEAMRPYQFKIFGNPSSAHGFGRASGKAVDRATKRIATFLNAIPEEIVYTSCGTESNNLTILGVAKANRNRGNHIITTSIEHPSVLNACRALQKDGWRVTYLPVGNDGLLRVTDLKKSLTKATVLVTIHLANSEIGVVQPIGKLAKVSRKMGAYFHTDACQAAAYLDLDVEKLGVDLLTFNGSKLYGPKGIGVLYVRRGTQIYPILYGGGQQQSLRSGTENVPGIVGLAKACEITEIQKVADIKNISSLRNQLQIRLKEIGCEVNVEKSPRLPNHLSVQIPTRETNLVGALDKLGVAVSAGSACSSKALTDSHVLGAIGLTSTQNNQTIRLTLGRGSNKKDLQLIIDAVALLKKS